jgi:hypothetical protein
LELGKGGGIKVDIDGESIGVGGGAAGAGDVGVGVTDVDGIAPPKDMRGCSTNRDERDLILERECE